MKKLQIDMKDRGIKTMTVKDDFTINDISVMNNAISFKVYDGDDVIMNFDEIQIIWLSNKIIGEQND